MSRSSSHLCLNCLDYHQKVLICSKCKVAQYCGKTCQKRDWSIHKIFCCIKKEENPALASISTSNTVQAILFRQDAQKPVLVQLSYNAKSKYMIPDAMFTRGFICGDATNDRIDTSQYIPLAQGEETRSYDSEALPSRIFDGQAGIDYVIPCGFTLLYDAKMTGNDSIPENKCIRALLEANLKAYYGDNYPTDKFTVLNLLRKTFQKLKKWRGNIILVKTDRYRELGLPAATYQDFELKDVPDLAMFIWNISESLCRS